VSRASHVLIVLAAIFASTFSSESARATDNPPLSFGAVPYQSPSKMAQIWLPVLKYLTEKSGVPLQFITAKDIATFEGRLHEGEMDITFMNPFLYVELHKTLGYEPLVKGKFKAAGILVVRADSPIQSLQDLQGRDLAFPSAAAFGPTMLPRVFLFKQNVKTIPHYVGSHESVYQSVASGLYAAGGGAKHTLATLDPTMRAKLRVLWSSDPFTSPPIAAHTRVSPTQRTRIVDTLLHMHEDPVGLRLIDQIGFAPGFETATDSDWNDVRSLNLGSMKALSE